MKIYYMVNANSDCNNRQIFANQWSNNALNYKHRLAQDTLLLFNMTDQIVTNKYHTSIARFRASQNVCIRLDRRDPAPRS
jgi:hypothetical protein